MKRMSLRVVLPLTLGFLIATITTGCTLSGADAAPTAETPIGPSAATEAPLPTQPPIFTPTRLPVIGSPTPSQAIDTFATVTANAQLTPGGPTPEGVTPGTPLSPAGLATSTPSVGVVTPTPFVGLPTATISSGGGTQTSSTSGTGSCPSTYTVQSGDNLFRIALKFRLTVAQLAAANGIANPEFIIVGTILKIPGCGTSAPTSAGTPTPIPGTSGGIKPQTGDTVATNGDILHTVKSGENLYRIALAYGLSWQAVATYNGITSPDQLVVGQVVHIPTK